MMDELRNRELEARKEETVETEEAVEQEIPRERKLLPVLPLRNTVVFPTTVVPLAAGQPRSLRLIDDVASGDRLLVLVLQKDPKKEGPVQTTFIRLGRSAVSSR
jgi:ATP-dependent Lon protease